MLLASSSRRNGSPASRAVTNVPVPSSPSLSLDAAASSVQWAYGSSASLRFPLDATGVGDDTRDEAGEGGSGLAIYNTPQ